MPDSASRPTDLIIGRGLLAAESMSGELRNRLVRELGRLGTKDMARALQLAQRILQEFEALHVNNFLATELAAWVTGARGVVDKVPPMLLGYVASHGGRIPPGGPPPKIGDCSANRANRQYAFHCSKKPLRAIGHRSHG